MTFKCPATLLLSPTSKTIITFEIYLGEKKPQTLHLCKFVGHFLCFGFGLWWVLFFIFQPKSDGFQYLAFPTALLVKYQIFVESTANPKVLVAHLLQGLACEQKRQNAFNRKGEGRNWTELLVKRGKKCKQMSC